MAFKVQPGVTCRIRPCGLRAQVPCEGDMAAREENKAVTGVRT